VQKVRASCGKTSFLHYTLSILHHHRLVQHQPDEIELYQHSPTG